MECILLVKFSILTTEGTKNVRIEHMLAPIYIADTSKIDENEDSEIV